MDQTTFSGNPLRSAPLLTRIVATSKKPYMWGLAATLAVTFTAAAFEVATKNPEPSTLLAFALPSAFSSMFAFLCAHRRRDIDKDIGRGVTIERAKEPDSTAQKAFLSFKKNTEKYGEKVIARYTDAAIDAAICLLLADGITKPETLVLCWGAAALPAFLEGAYQQFRANQMARGALCIKRLPAGSAVPRIA